MKTQNKPYAIIQFGEAPIEGRRITQSVALLERDSTRYGYVQCPRDKLYSSMGLTYLPEIEREIAAHPAGTIEASSNVEKTLVKRLIRATRKSGDSSSEEVTRYIRLIKNLIPQPGQ